jgi:hypothetical protein
MNWSLNFNQTSSWMIDDDTKRHSNLAGSSSQQSLDSNHNTPGGGRDGMSFYSAFYISARFNIFVFDFILKI